MCVESESANGLADLVFRYRDEPIYVLLNVLEIDFADALRAQPVRDGAHRLLSAEGDAMSGFEARLRLGTKFGFNSVDFGTRTHVLHCGGDSANHPTASNAN